MVASWIAVSSFWLSHELRAGIPWGTHEHPTGVPWASHRDPSPGLGRGYLMGSPWIACYPWVAHQQFMGDVCRKV